jgi:hypothetical protein
LFQETASASLGHQLGYRISQSLLEVTHELGVKLQEHVEFFAEVSHTVLIAAKTEKTRNTYAIPSTSSPFTIIAKASTLCLRSSTFCVPGPQHFPVAALLRSLCSFLILVEMVSREVWTMYVFVVGLDSVMMVFVVVRDSAMMVLLMVALDRHPLPRVDRWCTSGLRMCEGKSRGIRSSSS